MGAYKNIGLDIRFVQAVHWLKVFIQAQKNLFYLLVGTVGKYKAERLCDV